MSVVTNTILVFDGDQEELDKVNAFFAEGLGRGPGFVSVEDASLPRGWYGGSKGLECSLAIGAFNHLNIKALVDHLCALCLAGALDDQETQLLLREQDEVKFRIIDIDDEMRSGDATALVGTR